MHQTACHNAARVVRPDIATFREGAVTGLGTWPEFGIGSEELRPAKQPPPTAPHGYERFPSSGIRLASLLTRSRCRLPAGLTPGADAGSGSPLA